MATRLRGRRKLHGIPRPAGDGADPRRGHRSRAPGSARGGTHDKTEVRREGATGMTRHARLMTTALILTMLVAAALAPRAATAQSVERDAEAALNSLYRTAPAAKALAPKAKGV